MCRIIWTSSSVDIRDDPDLEAGDGPEDDVEGEGLEEDCLD